MKNEVSRQLFMEAQCCHLRICTLLNNSIQERWWEVSGTSRGNPGNSKGNPNESPGSNAQRRPRYDIALGRDPSKMRCLDGGSEDPSLPWPAPWTAGGSDPCNNYGHSAICSPSLVGVCLRA